MSDVDGVIVSRLTADGRITLREDRLIVTDAGGKRETPITPAEYRQYMATQFGVDVPRGTRRSRRR